MNSNEAEFQQRIRRKRFVASVCIAGIKSGLLHSADCGVLA